MSKDKKKKKKDKKNHKGNGSLATAAHSLKALSENPIVADVVAAALVATAAALKDSKKARRLADAAGDQLGDMAKAGADRSSPMWQLALEVGRRTLEALSDDQPSRGKAK